MKDSIQSYHEQDCRGLYRRCVCQEVAKRSNAALCYNVIRFFRLIWLLWLEEQEENREILFTSDINSVLCKKWTDHKSELRVITLQRN